MSIIAALLVCLAVKLTFAVEVEVGCRSPVLCPCGRSGQNVTICVPGADRGEACGRLSNCESCQQGLNFCSKCPEGLEGPFCTEETRKSRQKRQYPTYPVRWPRTRSTCPTLDSPKLGSIRCVSNNEQQTCTGRCLPGYRFLRDSESVMTLTCQDGTWTPRTSFPDCISGGHCDLVVQGAGSFNCTTGMDGTRCDVYCYNRYNGRYYCYPGREWEPDLPPCVVPKPVAEEMIVCRCRNGGTCDSAGRCVCPAGRTGSLCETAIRERKFCRDPGFVSNGFRRNTDGSDASSSRNFEEGHSLVYGCTEEYALRGSSLFTCKPDGTWSPTSLPICIRPATAAPVVLCPDPGQVANAERLNSDGSPSVGVQQYRVGQSVVYTCQSGFALQRRSLITCLSSGAWSFRAPYCTRVTLPNTTTRSPTVRPVPAELKFCADPGVDSNGSRQPKTPPSRRGFPQGSRLEYSCKMAYDLSGERSLFCLTSGEWSSGRPRCQSQARIPDVSAIEPVYCMNPGSFSNGQAVYHPTLGNRVFPPTESTELDQPEYPEGGRLQYSCNSGYTLVGRATLICESSGFWSAESPVCRKDPTRPNYCKYPGDIVNGRIVHVPSLSERSRPPSMRDDEKEDEYPRGSRLLYSCDDGYTLEGSSTLVCENMGIWSVKPPICSNDGPILYCDNPGLIMNGRMRYFPPSVQRRSGSGTNLDYDLEEYPEGSVLEYTCDEGYRLEGSYSLTCQSTGFWTAKAPTCVGDCGRSFMQTSQRVFKGDRTLAGDWPWVVSISAENNNSSNFVCGGAVLDSRTVITAAHCLVVANSFILRFGKHHFKIQDDDSEVLVRKSLRVIVHPDYNRTNSTVDSDIGLIIFQPRIRYSTKVQPICLPTPESTVRNIVTGRNGYVSGWGETEMAVAPDIMMLVNLPVITDDECLQEYSQQKLVISRNMFCAGHDNGKQMVCGGDSGSPFVFYDSIAERYTLEGLVSFGVRGQCGEAGKYAIFTKVFVFLPWIYRNMQ